MIDSLVHAPRVGLLKLFQAALNAVHGRHRVQQTLVHAPIDGPVALLAVGKAASAMAQGANAALGQQIVDALIVTKHGYRDELPWPVLEAGHPVPDARSLTAGTALIGFISRTPPRATVLVLLSGGASALVEELPAGVSLAALQGVTDWLLAHDFDISAINAVRKRLSCIKGGRLAARLAPWPVRVLAISDVPGNDPRAIGSGPLTADAAALSDALLHSLPESVQTLLQQAPPVPRADDPCFRNVHYEIIATLDDAKRAVVAQAQEWGAPVVLHEEALSGDAAATGQHLAQALASAPAGVLHVWGGETTVRLPPHPGRGGRNQQLALSAAIELQGHAGLWLLAAGTDGSDGPTEDAGALADGGTVARGAEEGMDAEACLAAADAGRFLEASGDLLQTGPTGTNVMDLVLGFRAH